MTSRLRIIVTGLLAQYPLGGVTWDYLSYVLGLARLGHDVFYFEDTGQWPYWPEDGGLVKGCERNVAYLDRVMQRFDLGDRWAYRFPWQDQWFGLPQWRRKEVIETADLVINVSGTLEDPEKYRGRGRLVYIDSDPVFTQVKIASGNDYFQRLVELHDVLFSFGEVLPGNCPDTGHTWVPTRQPINIDEWRTDRPRRDAFTTVMNWSAHKPMEFADRSYGQKDVEFRKYLDLPARVAPASIEIASQQGKASKLPVDLLAHKGWRIVEPNEVCRDLDQYRSYIETSFGEWSVAKGGYVVGQSGWFSCRSACYLAAGRPVVVQETGFSQVLPVGEGIVVFHDLDEAALGIREVTADWDRHSRAAREIAEQWFDSSRVLGELIERALQRVPGHV